MQAILNLICKTRSAANVTCGYIIQFTYFYCGYDIILHILHFLMHLVSEHGASAQCLCSSICQFLMCSTFILVPLYLFCGQMIRNIGVCLVCKERRATVCVSPCSHTVICYMCAMIATECPQCGAHISPASTCSQPVA